MERSKTASYLGFARRAGKLTLGVFAAGTLKKGVFLLAAEKTVGENSRKEILKLQKRFGCPLVYVEGLGEMVGKSGCVLAAVRDRGFASAIAAAQGRAGREKGAKKACQGI